MKSQKMKFFENLKNAFSSKTKIICILALLLLLLPAVIAEEHDEEEFEIFGIEGEEMLNLGSGILSIILF